MPPPAAITLTPDDELLERINLDIPGAVARAPEDLAEQSMPTMTLRQNLLPENSRLMPQ